MQDTQQTHDLQKLVPLSVIAKRMSVAHSTAWRWATRGVQIGSERIVLESVTIGGAIRTTLADLEAFESACQQARLAAARDRQGSGSSRLLRGRNITPPPANGLAEPQDAAAGMNTDGGLRR